MPQTALERLHAYVERMERTNLKRFEIAYLIGINQTHLSKILSGQRRPGLDTAALIEKQTGIPTSSWSDRKRGRTRKSHRNNENKPLVGNEISHA
jgi:transcriptional regulator with XRE-family HTH domain